jgi:hypothetical protein
VRIGTPSLSTPSNNPVVDGRDEGMTAVKARPQARRHGGFGTPLPRWARIIVASVMLTTGTAAVVTRDLLVRWGTQTRLQLDANRMAIAGAVFLPGAPARAMLAAAHSAALCGLSRQEVVHAEAASDRMSFEVRLRGIAPLRVLQFLGLSDVNVKATARVRTLVNPGPSLTPRDSGGSTVLSSLRPSATLLDSLGAASAKPASGKVASNENCHSLARQKSSLPTRSCGGKQPDFWPA